MAAVMDRVIEEGEGTTEAQWATWPGIDRLPAVSPADLVPEGARIVVVAPHPDDEVLACGGLLSMLCRAGDEQRESLIVAVTDGDASHPGSQSWPRERLLRERPAETRRALQRLGLSGETLRLALPDGGVPARRDALCRRLESVLRAGDVVCTTWRMDGHPDHEATGKAAATACARIGARLLEVPVWAWHWAAPGDARLPWQRAARLLLDPMAQRAKRAAVQQFQSQLHDDPSTGNRAILRGSTIERASRPFEVFFT